MKNKKKTAKLWMYRKVFLGLLLYSLAFSFSETAEAQQMPRSTKTPQKKDAELLLDKNVVTGKLANGFTYFIRRNTEPENRVQLYLANKVGSMQEEEDQLGLAHFLEHMAFNGTRHYPNDELVTYLQKIGVSFGRDLNAVTDFDATIYQLPVPSDNPEILSNALQILRDWTSDALLDPVEIDKERGVILEEKRMRNSPDFRMLEQLMPVHLNHSFYTKRMPIGTEEVLKTFKPETLRRFYTDWYRPDLQAIIVVGDIDVAKIEQKIKSLFGDLKNPQSPKIRKQYKIDLDGRNGFVAFTDAEMSEYAIKVVTKHPELVIKTKEDYRQAIIQQIFNEMLGARINEFSLEPNQPYIGAGAGVGSYLGGISFFQAIVSAKKGEWEKGFKAMWEIMERVKRYGFVDSELERAKAGYLSRIEAKNNEISKTSSAEYVNEYLDYFLKGQASIGIDAEFALTKELFPEISTEDINRATRAFITDKNRDIVVTAPDTEKGNLPKENEILAWIKDVEAKKIAPYHDDAANIVLMDKKPVAGKVVSEKKIDKIGIREWTFSNGLKVVLKPTSFKNDQITFNGFSSVGTSAYNDSDYQSAATAAYIVGSSGVGKLTQTQLSKFYSNKPMMFSTDISERSTSITGSTGLKNLEDFLQLTHLYFTQPRKDTTVFANIISNARERLSNPDNDPENQFADSVRSISYNYDIRRTPPSLEKINQVNLDKAYKIYSERFANAADFTFVITGNFQYDKIKPLLELYLGSLPSTGKKTPRSNRYIKMKEGIYTKTINKGNQNKAAVEMIFSGEYAPNTFNDDQFDALGSILQIKITQRLREQEGGVYSPSVTKKREKYPKGNYNINISFGCAPENVDKLIAAAKEEIEKIKLNGPLAVDIEKQKAGVAKSNATDVKTNNFWSYYLRSRYRDDEDLFEVLDYKKNLEYLTVESVQKAAKEHLKGNNLLTFKLLPESYQP